MYYHKLLGPTPTFGVELEVAEWYGDKTMYDVAKRLSERGYMPPGTYDEERHDYNCRCNTCQNIGVNVIYPGQWKMQRDASLPHATGAEYISSPFMANGDWLVTMRESLEIISADAVGDSTRLNERGGDTSVGMHVHVHTQGPEMKGMIYDMTDLTMNGQSLLYKFVPELFALAGSAGTQRGLEYRIPSLGEDHHSFVAPAQRGTRRLEWRIWEAAYEDIDYMMGAIVMSCAATQLLHREDVTKKLGAIADMLAWDDSNKQIDHILSEFSAERAELLATSLLEGTSVKNDKQTNQILSGFLERIVG